jgi:protoporphyrinogen oxidase
MDKTEYLVVGAGISGLSFTTSLLTGAREKGQKAPETIILEADSEPGGYCKTIKQDGFVWDYSGHFFHFKHPEIEAWLLERMDKSQVRRVEKRSFIYTGGTVMDFPFQKNIHQLPKSDFIDCLVELYFKDENYPEEGNPSFQKMLYQKFGKGIAERFLIPYNEKLYACDLNELDVDAMGRFFPYADIKDIIRNMKEADNKSYNATFTYPKGGAIEYVNAFLSEVPESLISYEEKLVAIDLEKKVATTNKREITFQHLVSSAPLNRLLQITGVQHDEGAFSWNQVLVFNLGFDKKGPKDPHWVYFPDRNRRFYRVGFYDNIHDGDRMSLYVEIGAKHGASLDVESEKTRVLSDLKAEGIITDHELVSWHTVTMDPAYVHITKASLAETARTKAILEEAGVYPVGRYGGWTYCAIEDNIVETRALAKRLAS